VRRRRTLLLLLLAAWGAWGVRTWLRSAPRPPPPPGELRGAWHVHTTHSDGRGTLAEVVAAARDAGLQFVVVTDHNLVTPGEAGWHDGVLVVEAHEASTRWGHVVAPGAPRALDEAERHGHPLAAIEALGGKAVLAHPFHAERAFTGWGNRPWHGLEVVSNDTAWGEVVAGRAFGRLFTALATLPFDGAQAVVARVPGVGVELAALDEALGGAPPGPRRPDGRLAPGKVLLCSADAHGYPSYRAAFAAFSMHVPVVPSGDGAADGRAVLDALLDGRAACVFDGVAPAARIALAPAGDGTLLLSVSSATGEAADPAEARLARPGAGGAADATAEAAPGGLRFRCPGGCGPGTYRAEVRLGGRPWILTNPVVVE
jgi:hypothetical protein